MRAQKCQNPDVGKSRGEKNSERIVTENAFKVKDLFGFVV